MLGKTVLWFLFYFMASSENVKYIPTIRPRLSTPEYLMKRKKKTYLYTASVIIAALVIIAPDWTQPNVL